MTNGRKAIVFLGLTFGISWSAVVSAWVGGGRELSDIPIVGNINVFSPSLAAVFCSMVFERGERLNALGLHFRPNRWWLWAALIAIALSALNVFFRAPTAPFTLLGLKHTAGVVAAALGQNYTDAGGYLLHASAMAPFALFAFAIFFTVSEELGWRGYLYHLWRPLGFWRYSLSVGVIWGIWHWPMIYLFGLNYPDHRAVGLIIFTLFSALLSVLMTLVRDRGRSVWAAGILHGVWNAVSLAAAITFVLPETLLLSAVAAVAVGAALVAVFQREHPYSGHCQRYGAPGAKPGDGR